MTTIEALSPDRSNPVQQAWVAENLPQCGFCMPGMIMAAAVLLKRNSDPTDADIDAAAPPPGITPQDAARVVPALRVP